MLEAIAWACLSLILSDSWCKCRGGVQAESDATSATLRESDARGRLSRSSLGVFNSLGPRSRASRILSRRQECSNSAVEQADCSRRVAVETVVVGDHHD